MAADCCGAGQATIDKLPDDVLLETFDFYLAGQNLDQWHTLVHVCRRWRNVVFASPSRLDLRLLCRHDRPVRAMLDIWPALPINIENSWGEGREQGLDNVVAALEHPDRVRSISLMHVRCPPPLLKAMQVRFPELTELQLWNHVPVLPDSLLGGSAPRLRRLRMMYVPFPAARTLILSARDLVDLRLDNIPHLGYTPPASMVACLSSLNMLESLSLGFESPQSYPEQPSPPPQSRVVLPALVAFAFDGMSKYSEDLVARIDTPMLNRLHVTFFQCSVFLDVRHLKEFIGRAKGLKPSKAAELRLHSWTIHLVLQQPHTFMLGVRCRRFDWEVSTLALLCGQVSHLFSLVERLDLRFIWRGPLTGTKIVMSNQFLEIFRLFAAARSLCVHKDLALPITVLLQELVGARATKVLPNLRDLLLEGSAKSRSIQEAMQPFVDARRLSGQPVAVHYLEETQKVAR
jgi:pimeloyl-ACP methyl ester carboxylesterase